MVRMAGSHRQFKHPSKPGLVTIAGETKPYLAARNRAEHPETGGGEEAVMSRYAVVIEQAEDGGYGAYAPDLPGCVAVGETEAEVIALMRDAVELHLEAMREAA